MELNRRIGENVRTVRQRLQLTQGEMAEKLAAARPGGRRWTQTLVSALEGARLARVDTDDLEDLQSAFGIRAGWFLDNDPLSGVELRDPNSGKGVYLISDDDPINTLVHPDAHYRDPYIVIPDGSFWTDPPRPLQRERLPLAG